MGVTLRRVFAALCLAGLVTALAAGTGQAAQGEVLGCANLRPTMKYRGASVRVELDKYPRHGELYSRFSGLPRREAYIVWLLPRPRVHAEALIGGAAPGDEGRFSGSLIVPGGHPVSEKNLVHAEKVVLTSMSIKRARRISRRYQADHYRNAHPIRGAVLARGGVQPPRDSVCPRLG